MGHNSAMEHHERSKHEAEYADHAPFSPFDYQRHYTYSHSALPPPGYGNAYKMGGPHPPMDGNRFDSARGNKMTGPRTSINGEGHAMTLGDQQPTYVGHIKSANDAILLLSACDLPAKAPRSPDSSKSRDDTFPPPRRVTRRLLDAERADLVSSGSVFVWDEKEAGMKRWTDGRVWSASRVSGCFLTYRELEARKKVSTSASSMADGPSTNQYKPDGLIKQSFSITTSSGRKLHVISYFTKRDIREGRLRRVSEDPRFVGEGGGEWGLKVDDKEYSFPDMHQISRAQGQGDGGASGDGTNRERGEDESSDMSDMSDARSPLPVHATDAVKKEDSSSKTTGSSDYSRKRSMPEDATSATGNAPVRPRLARLRSSSMSGMPTPTSSRTRQVDASIQSNTSLDTTIPSASDSESQSREIKTGYNRGLMVGTGGPRSSAIRALVSPTLPRESAIRGSACEMKPTQSQDCANAVGALLSLAGNSNKSLIDEVKHTPTAPSPLATASTPNSPTTPNSNGLGLNVKAPPKRRDSDRAALNKFSIRL